MVPLFLDIFRMSPSFFPSFSSLLLFVFICFSLLLLVLARLCKTAESLSKVVPLSTPCQRPRGETVHNLPAHRAPHFASAQTKEQNAQQTVEGSNTS
jgi:hypothetical protein